MRYVQEAETESTLGADHTSRGAASLRFVLDHWNVASAASEFSDELSGAALGAGLEDDLMAFADRKGLWAHAEYSSFDRLRERVRLGFPVIVGLQDAWKKLNTRRTVVVTGVDPLGDVVHFREEVGTDSTLAMDDFLRLWRPVNFWMLVICPADKPSWPMGVSELVGRARFHERRNEIGHARADYENALARAPSNPGLCMALANLYRRSGQEEMAEELYRRALQANPADGHAANNLAYVLAEKMSTLDEAATLARKAAALEPTNPTTLDTLGYVYLKQGNYIAAAATLERAHTRAGQLPVDQRNEIALHLARAHYQSGQINEARLVVSNLLRSQPGCEVPPDLRSLVNASSTGLP